MNKHSSKTKTMTAQKHHHAAIPATVTTTAKAAAIHTEYMFPR